MPPENTSLEPVPPTATPPPTPEAALNVMLPPDIVAVCPSATYIPAPFSAVFPLPSEPIVPPDRVNVPPPT